MKEENMNTDQETAVPRRGVSLRQVATVLQDFGYRGLVDEDSNCVHSAAMGLDFRVVLYGLIEDSANEDEYESYTLSLGVAEFDGLTAGLETIQLCP